MSSINEGYKQTKVGVIPEEWEVVRFDNIFERVRRKNTTNNTNVLTISAQHGLINQEDFFNKSVASKDLSGYILLKKGEFAYNKSYSSGYPMGAFKRLNFYDEGVLSSLYIYFKIKDDNSDFYEQYFEAGLMNREIYKIAQEGARNHGLLNMSVKEFFHDMLIIKPPLKEQQKIAQILTTWDEAISKQEALIAEKEQLKKGLMQKLLSGEVRFEGFDGEWEEVRLKKVVKCLDNKRIPLNKQERQKMQGDIPYYGSTSIVDYVNDYIFDEDLVLVSEDGGYFYEYETRPIAFYITGKSWVNNHVHIIKNINESLDLKFLYYSLVHKSITAFLNGGTRAKLNKKDLLLLKIKLPPLEEQQKIAQVLTTADKEIELLKKELEALKEQKRGLMQKLLTGEVRV